MTDNPYLAVPCPICKVPAASECVDTADGRELDSQAHTARALRAHIVSSAIAENLALEEQQ